MKKEIMKSKKKIELKNWGEDTYILAALGHHDLDEFLECVKEEYSSWVKHLGDPELAYVKKKKRSGYEAGYDPCSPDTEGAIPVTIITEGQQSLMERKKNRRTAELEGCESR